MESVRTGKQGHPSFALWRTVFETSSVSSRPLGFAPRTGCAIARAGEPVRWRSREIAINRYLKPSKVEQLRNFVREATMKLGLTRRNFRKRHLNGTREIGGLLSLASGAVERPKKFGLVLQGGGALGAYEVGAIEYLYESGMECAIVSGASSGAMNAATLAGAKEYPPTVLRALWEKLVVEPPLSMIPAGSWAMLGSPNMYAARHDYWNLPSWTYFCETAPLRKTLEDLLDWDQVRDSNHMRVIVSASGVETGETAYFSNFDREPFRVEHVLASGSLPPGFAWTIIDGRAYWDGGLTDNTPLKPVIDNLRGEEPESMPIFVVDVFSSSAPLPTNLRQVVQRMFELILQNKLKADSETARTYARFIRILRQVDAQLPAHAAVRKDPNWQSVLNYALLRDLRTIDIEKPDHDSSADFSRATILRRISAGYEATKRSLEGSPLWNSGQSQTPSHLGVTIK
jgi:predicted acylesterase/phospholipase RssA